MPEPNQSSPENLSSSKPKKTTPLGTDPALSLRSAQGKLIKLTYWDVWFALVAMELYEANLELLAMRLKEEKNLSFLGGWLSILSSREDTFCSEGRVPDEPLGGEIVEAGLFNSARLWGGTYSWPA